MDGGTEARDYGGAIKRLGLYVLAPVLLLMLAVLGGAYIRDIAVTDLLRDPSAVLDGSFYVGLFSTSGIALWSATAAMCLLTLAAKPTGGTRALVFAGAVISLILGIDDGFLVHETAKNVVSIPSPVTIAVYGIVAILLLRPAWGYLVSRTDVVVFWLALALFALSVLLDGAGELGLPTPPLSAVIEDVAKFLGIVTWTTFFAWVCRDVVRGTAQPA